MPTCQHTFESSAIWTALAKRGLGTKDLAAATGFDPNYCSQVVHGWSTCRVARCKIEDFLCLAIWSTDDEFAARQADAAFYETLLETLSKRELVSLGKSRGLLSRRSTGLTRSHLLGVLRAHRIEHKPGQAQQVT